MFKKGPTLRSLLSFLLVLELESHVTSDIEPSYPLPMSGGGGVSASGSSGETIGSSSNGVVWSPRQVVTKMGTVQGFIVRPPNGYEGVEVFLNLPYATPPEGSLRFMPPVSGSPWKGTRRSESPSPVCPQVLPNIRNESEALKMMPRGRLTYLRRLLPHLRNQSEDCLYLNIHLPAKVAEGRVEGKLPVMVFVHGEDYGYGGGHPYDPTMLVSQGNIIVVTMNYRLGILGFLNADADGHFKLPFNFALLDQIAALQWVQENIELFGGDRSRVTLMGHGKGAVCVNFLMISNAVPTGLLFHRVILSSGSALSPLTADLSKGPELARKFAKKVKCPMEPSSTMLQCLRELPLKYFLESELWNLFGPTGDGIVVKHSLPSESVIMNRISHYPLIFGVVRAEFLPSLNNHDATYGLESERRRELLRQFIRKHYSFHRNEILAGAIHEYTDWEKPAQHPLNVRDETIDALADAQVVAPLIKIGDLHAASSRTKAYFYVFDYQSKNSEYQQRLGCVSGEDLLYIFGAPLYFYENDYGGNNGGGDMESHHHPVDQPLHHQSPSQQNGMIIPSGKTSASSSNELNTFSQRKEKWRKRNERMGGLGVFAGNFTWYEVQLSATLIQLWASFIRSGNPNGDIPPKPVVGMLSGSSSSSSSSPGGGTYQGRLGMGKGKVKDPGEQLSSEGSETLHGGSGGSGVTSDNNRLRPSRDSEANDNNKLVGSLGPTPLEEPQHQHHLQQHYHQPPPISVEWPEYDSLDKKYLIFDLRPRIRNHYRAHKLSFWLHLVPDYQKNNEGTSAISIHHEMSASVYSMIPPAQNLSRASVIQPTIFASGLHDPGKTRYNSSSGGGKKRSRNHNHQDAGDGTKVGVPLSPGGDLEERQRQRDSAVLHVPSSSSSSVNPNDPLESPFGFHTYSTALSVTIAIGCSLLILNILIFATFYYEREKRRQEHRRQKPNTDNDSARLAANASNHDDDALDEQRQGRRHPSLPRHQSRSMDSSSSAAAGGRGTNFFRQQSSTSNHDTFSIPLTTSSISCGGGGGGGSGSCSASASLKRRRDNGASNNSSNGNIVLHHFPPPPSMEVTTTTVFCEHYVNEEDSSSALNAYNELYTSPPSYLEDEEVAPLGLEVEDDDDEEMEVEVVTSMTPPAGSSSDQHQLLQSCRSDMSYGTYGGGCGSSATGLERGFFPISPAPPASSTSTAAATGGTGMSSNSLGGGGAGGSLRQKRKAFAISGGIASGCGGGALNEFSMSDVRVEPVTNVPNFSPQSSPRLGDELFEIERIPTVEELIGADPSNPNLMPTTISLPMSSNCSRNDGGSRSSSSIATVILCPAPPPLSASDCDFLQST